MVRKLKQVPWAAVQNTRSLHVKVTDNSLSVCIRWHVLHFMWQYQVILLCSVWLAAPVTTVDEIAVVIQTVVGHLPERLLNEHFLSSLRKVTCTANKITSSSKQKCTWCQAKWIKAKQNDNSLWFSIYVFFGCGKQCFLIKHFLSLVNIIKPLL